MKINESLKKLESFVTQLENRDIDLDNAVATYSKSVKLAKTLLSDLKLTKARIVELDSEIGHNDV